MNERDLDRRLEGLFRTALDLTEAEEEALWRDFHDRRQAERYVWESFIALMTQARRQVQRAAEWSAWPARGLPGIG